MLILWNRKIIELDLISGAYFTGCKDDIYIRLPFDKHYISDAEEIDCVKKNYINSIQNLFPFFIIKWLLKEFHLVGCWKPTAVYGITDKICILGLLTTFPPADGGRKDVIHHLFTMGFIYSSVNSCPREWVIEFKCEALGYLLPFKFVFRV